MTATSAIPDTLADVVHALGDIPLYRILWRNLGTATEEDQLELCGRKLRVELVDGCLVHKGIDRQTLNELLASVAPGDKTLADVVDGLGGLPLDRILWNPKPGTATEADVLRVRGTELVDGVLIDKVLDYPKGMADVVIGARLLNDPGTNSLGGVSIGGGLYRVGSCAVRRPDVAFAYWHRRRDDTGTHPDIVPAAPDLVVEVPTPDNTPAELLRKYRDYFQAGTRLIWEVGAATRTVTVYRAPGEHTVLTDTDALTGDPVLPGFALPLADLFNDPQLNPRP